MEEADAKLELTGKIIALEVEYEEGKITFDDMMQNVVALTYQVGYTDGYKDTMAILERVIKHD